MIAVDGVDLRPSLQHQQGQHTHARLPVRVDDKQRKGNQSVDLGWSSVDSITKPHLP